MKSNWDIRRIYLYLVSFATLMMMVFGTVSAVQGAINLAYPNPVPYYPETPAKYADVARNDPKLTDAEIKSQIATDKKQAEENRKNALKSDRYNRIMQIINNFALLAVASPVYFYHWKKVQRSEAV